MSVTQHRFTVVESAQFEYMSMQTISLKNIIKSCLLAYTVIDK